MNMNFQNYCRKTFRQKHKCLILFSVLLFIVSYALYSSDQADTISYNLIPTAPLTATLKIGLETYSVSYPHKITVSVPKAETDQYIMGYIISKADVDGKTISNQVHIALTPFTGDNGTAKSWWFLESGIAQDNDNLVSYGNTGNRNIYVNPPAPNYPTANSEFEPLDNNRVFLVDYNATNGNMLFRGNMPVKAGFKTQEFDFEGLNSIFKKRFKQQVPDSGFPGNYFLIDVSLICDIINDEGAALYIEYKYFAGKNLIADAPLTVATNMNPDSFQPGMDNPKTLGDTDNIGTLLWWPIEPGGWDLSKTASPYMRGDKKQQPKPLQDLINTLANLMNDNNDLPYIIYVHCMNGQDRTSEVAVCYLMKKYGFPLQKAYIYGTTLLNSSGNKVRLIPRKEGFEAYTDTMRAYSQYIDQPETCWHGDLDSTENTLPDYPWDHSAY